MAQRTRDPARREKILDAAASLLATNGFHSVSMADIGERAGITGSGIYRHFSSKSAILVELFEYVIDDLLDSQQLEVIGTQDLRQGLNHLIEGQVELVVDKRRLAQVYHNQIHNLPREDRVRLRRKQRLYIEEWVNLLGALTPAVDQAVWRTLTHTALGAIQSVLFHPIDIPVEDLREFLRRAALTILEPDLWPDVPANA